MSKLASFRLLTNQNAPQTCRDSDGRSFDSDRTTRAGLPITRAALKSSALRHHSGFRVACGTHCCAASIGLRGLNWSARPANRNSLSEPRASMFRDMSPRGRLHFKAGGKSTSSSKRTGEVRYAMGSIELLPGGAQRWPARTSPSGDPRADQHLYLHLQLEGDMESKKLIIMRNRHWSPNYRTKPCRESYIFIKTPLNPA
jgi:hypothetical protein